MSEARHARDAKDERDLAALVASALQQPAPEGARIVALHWLAQLHDARRAWAHSLRAADSEQDEQRVLVDRVDALHKARVALRRLRAVLREHRAVLDGDPSARIRVALRKLSRVTSDARDADVQRAWLDAERDALTGAAHSEACDISLRLEQHRDAQRAQVARVFHGVFDTTAHRLERQLSAYAVRHHIGRATACTTFAAHLAHRVLRGTERLQQDLATLAVHVSDPSPARTLALMHAVRIRLKRQRAVLAPFVEHHPAIGAWYALATSGQDVLGAMRDASLLAELSRRSDATALAMVLERVALAHRASFMQTWYANAEALAHVARVQTDAAQALQSLGAQRDGDALPMEIERKYLLRDCPPEAESASATFIEQGWLPGVLLRERLRRAVASDGSVRHTRTIKLGPIGARIEIEEDTDPVLFAALWPWTASARIRKRRFSIPAGPHVWEIDVFLDRNLVIAEVELASVTDVPTVPGWLAPYVVRDVSTDPAYLNSVMARAEPSDVEHNGPVA